MCSGLSIVDLNAYAFGVLFINSFPVSIVQVYSFFPQSDSRHHVLQVEVLNLFGVEFCVEWKNLVSFFYMVLTRFDKYHSLKIWFSVCIFLPNCQKPNICRYMDLCLNYYLNSIDYCVCCHLSTLLFLLLLFCTVT